MLVLRKDPVDHEHFHAPTVLPVLGAITCAFLVGPWTGRDDAQYRVAAGLLALGVVLWVCTGCGTAACAPRRPASAIRRRSAADQRTAGLDRRDQRTARVRCMAEFTS